LRAISRSPEPSPKEKAMTTFDTGDTRTPTRSLAAYLHLIGVPDYPARTSPFDPGYDPATLESHLEQSHHLMSVLKISMACWQIASEAATRRKVKAARHWGVTTCTGGGPFEIAATFGTLPEFFDLCADIGVTRIEAGEGFTDQTLDARDIVRL